MKSKLTDRRGLIPTNVAEGRLVTAIRVAKATQKTIEYSRFTIARPIRSMVPVWPIARCSRKIMLDEHS